MKTNYLPTTSVVNGRGKYQALPYNKALLQFAKKEGLPAWTVKDRIKLVARYELMIAIKN